LHRSFAAKGAAQDDIVLGYSKHNRALGSDTAAVKMLLPRSGTILDYSYYFRATL